MDLKKDWARIRAHFNKSMSTSFHVSIGSVNQDNQPTVTPVGTFFLNGNQTGFYFEVYATKLPQNATTNPNVCILGVNSSAWLWFKSVLTGRFKYYPAVKLYGKLGVKRKATAIEVSRFNKRMKALKWSKGYKILWGKNMEYVREITINKAEKINLKEMTKSL